MNSSNKGVCRSKIILCYEANVLMHTKDTKIIEASLSLDHLLSFGVFRIISLT